MKTEKWNFFDIIEKINKDKRFKLSVQCETDNLILFSAHNSSKLGYQGKILIYVNRTTRKVRFC